MVGSITSDPGATCGISVICAEDEPPCHVAVTVAVVCVETAPVGSENDTEPVPCGTVTTAGGVTFVELLVRLTLAPPGGARPFSITTAPGVAPPVMLLGKIERELSDVGFTVSDVDAVAELSEAVSVTGVVAVTCPTWN